MIVKRERILTEVSARRVTQISLGHTPEQDDLNTPSDWITLLIRQVGKAANATSDQKGTPTIREKMLDLAALAVACVERIDRL